jgi:hypothetical protein
MIEDRDDSWRSLVVRSLRWTAAARWLRDPDSAEFARVIAEVFAARLCGPDQGVMRDANEFLAAQRRKILRKK